MADSVKIFCRKCGALVLERYGTFRMSEVKHDVKCQNCGTLLFTRTRKLPGAPKE